MGNLNWLSVGTGLDTIATITNILAKYMHCATPSHVMAAKYVVRYLKGCPDLGISFSYMDTHPDNLQAYLNFPIEKNKPTGLTYANWGPQDASIPKPDDPPIKLDLFKSRSISGFVIWYNGPLH